MDDRRSNHIYFAVDFLRGVARQRCHDPECRGWESEPVQLPEEVRAEREELWMSDPGVLDEIERVEREWMQGGAYRS